MLSILLMILRALTVSFSFCMWCKVFNCPSVATLDIICFVQVDPSP